MSKNSKRSRTDQVVNNAELSVGRPRYKPNDRTFSTGGNVKVIRSVVDRSKTIEKDIEELVDKLDEQRGCIFESAYEYPGRYARWTMGFVNPPLALEGWARKFRLTALNERGRKILPAFEAAFHECDAIDKEKLDVTESYISGSVFELEEGKRFPEEERSKQSSIFSVVRSIIDMWRTETNVDPQLGLYGSFGYDLTFQFEPVELKHERDPNQRDLLLYLPDSILIYDKQSAQAWRLDYDFEVKVGRKKLATKGLPRDGSVVPFKGNASPKVRRDHEPGEYAKSVEKAREEFRVGNLFECVLRQTFYEPASCKPSDILRMLRETNPSPYMFIINLGDDEYLVGASPEMFVRVEQTSEGMRVETCPISGTIKRGKDALEDHKQIKQILADPKEESELTMCTDVDRNDKSRICRQGSVEVIGRRQLELYSKLIHTVDHVEGYLRDGFDALDAFLCHTWAVTVTGAPKTWAIQFVERNEKSPRAWYGGAVGLVGFDMHLNTGMTLRTIHLKNGVAGISAGATLLYDSVPMDEEKETELKASAFREAVLNANKLVEDRKQNGESAKKKAKLAAGDGSSTSLIGTGKNVVLIDHQDSFVHTLANYIRQTGANVTTVRYGISKEDLLELKPNMVVMSPGPGKPTDFDCSGTLAMLIESKIPVFGVCLGLQSMVEHFGGKLDVLGYPMHGKPSMINLSKTPSKWKIFDGIQEPFQVARYHSLYADRASVEENSKCPLSVTARLDDGTIMAIEHPELPMAAVQFHPESILTRPSDGLAMLSNALTNLKYT